MKKEEKSDAVQGQPNYKRHVEYLVEKQYSTCPQNEQRNILIE